jgi:hypothetical protein
MDNPIEIYNNKIENEFFKISFAGLMEIRKMFVLYLSMEDIKNLPFDKIKLVIYLLSLRKIIGKDLFKSIINMPVNILRTNKSHEVIANMIYIYWIVDEQCLKIVGDCHMSKLMTQHVASYYDELHKPQHVFKKKSINLCVNI